MKQHINKFVVIGASRGLGSALVNELLINESYQVFGIARTRFEEVKYYGKWRNLERYHHIEADITTASSSEIMKSVCSEFSYEPVQIIFNAAVVESDVINNSTIDYDIFDKVNYVGIDGFRNVLKAFEGYLLNYGGVFVGISSFSAFIPPVFDPRIAYPSSKAYLDMSLRCLRSMWDRRYISVVTVHLGHIEETQTGILSRSYTKTAEKLVKSLTGKKIPSEINYPKPYTLVYKYILNSVPDFIYLKFFRILHKSGIK
ncbi:MAG: SDR family oxidoreductase [Colwellia sp.]|nr:SDR family oxidoreductase [Colwellia sp.]